MIEIHLILLGINLLQWNRGDRRGRKEVRMKDRMIEGIVEKLPLFAGPHIGF